MFSSFRTKAEQGIVFHIGSGSVGAALVKLSSGKPTEILYSLREHMPYHDTVDADRFTADMLAALKTVNARIAKESVQHVPGFSARHIFYVFSSPWIATHTKTVTVSEAKPFALTKGRVEQITAQADTVPDGYRAFEHRAIDIRLNGYQVADPYGKQATSAEISVFTAIAPKKLLDDVLSASMTTYHPKDTHISSFPLAAFSSVRQAFHNETDFIFLDIGGELSDMVIVKNGLISETASFPLGIHFLSRAVQSGLGVSDEEAMSRIRVYSEGIADTAMAATLKPVLDKAMRQWMDGFYAAIAKISKGVTVPNRVLFAVRHDLAPIFMRTLGLERSPRFGVSDLQMTIVPIKHDALKNLVNFGQGIGHDDRDMFLAISSAFAGTLYDSAAR